MNRTLVFNFLILYLLVRVLGKLYKLLGKEERENETSFWPMAMAYTRIREDAKVEHAQHFKIFY